MAVSKKGCRNISVDGQDFNWRATGNDGWITVVVWPSKNESSRAVATIGYHHDIKKVAKDHYSSNGQLVVTNRIIREIILYIGVAKLVGNHGQINVGRIEEFYDVNNALRMQFNTS